MNTKQSQIPHSPINGLSHIFVMEQVSNGDSRNPFGAQRFHSLVLPLDATPGLSNVHATYCGTLQPIDCTLFVSHGCCWCCTSNSVLFTLLLSGDLFLLSGFLILLLPLLLMSPFLGVPLNSGTRIMPSLAPSAIVCRVCPFPFAWGFPDQPSPTHYGGQRLPIRLASAAETAAGTCLPTP